MQDYHDFLDSYAGDNTPEALEAYEFLVARAEAAIQILELGNISPEDSAALTEDVVAELIAAETIAYRFQALHREPIVESAIYVQDTEHLEYTFGMGGSVSYRRDWLDREEESVRAFLSVRYPTLAGALETGLS